MQSSSEQLTGWVALCLVPRVGGKTLSALLNTFGSPRSVFEASREALLKVPLIGHRTVDAIQQIDLKHVELKINQWLASNIHLLTWTDPFYPVPLQAVPDRPPLLFARGNLDQDWSRVIAIVGTREPTPQMAHLAETIGRELAGRGWMVASGLARGIDAAGHWGALDGGRTVAVMGSGVDNIQPQSNRDLARRILKQGAIYAEVHPQAQPAPSALMARNRLISGLAKATIVVQAGVKSGSMEAARRTRQQQKTVLTIDHPDFAGNQELIRMEALPLAPNFGDWDALADLLEHLPDPPRQLSLFDL